MKTINCHTKNNIAVFRPGLGAMRMVDLQQGIPKEYTPNSAKLSVDLDENGLFKF